MMADRTTGSSVRTHVESQNGDDDGDDVQDETLPLPANTRVAHEERRTTDDAIRMRSQIIEHNWQSHAIVTETGGLSAEQRRYTGSKKQTKSSNFYSCF
jgi:hypothetical protein